TNTDVQRRERRRQCRVSPVQITVARVLDDDIADNARARSDDEPRGEQMVRRHLEAPAGELRIGAVKLLHEVDELAVMETIRRASGDASRRARVGRNLESLKTGGACILQRRKAAND